MDIYTFNELMAALSSATGKMACLGREFSGLHEVNRLANELFVDSMMDEIYGKSPAAICYKIHTGRTAGIPIECKAIESVVTITGRAWSKEESKRLLNRTNIKSLIDYKKANDESFFPRSLDYTVPIRKSCSEPLEEARVQVNLNDLSAKITFNTSAAVIDISDIGTYRAEVKLPLHRRPIPVYLSAEWVDAYVILPVLTELGYTKDTKLSFSEWTVIEHYYSDPGAKLEDVPKIYRLCDLLDQLGRDPYDLPQVRIVPSFCKDINIQFSLKDSWARSAADYVAGISWQDGQIISLTVIPRDNSAAHNYSNNFILNNDIRDNMDELVLQATTELERLLDERTKK